MTKKLFCTRVVELVGAAVYVHSQELNAPFGHHVHAQQVAGYLHAPRKG
jgi:hypothetical protein